VFITAGILAGWTIPPETLGKGIIDFGKFRQHLADIIPVLPSIATKLPRLLYVVAPHFGTLFPHLGTVAPHLGALLPHAEMLTRIIPKLSTKLDLLLQGDLLEKVAPAFAALDAEHMARLEMVLDDVVDKLDVLAPHIGTFTPILEDGIMVADRMLPFIEFVIPHLVALQADLDWLLPFAEIEGVEKLIPLMDKIVPQLQAVKPLAESLRPHLPMLLKQAPLIADNIDVFLELLPSLGPNEIDPLLYWCGNLMPLANSMGVLKSRTLMKAALPLSHLLPRVPRHAHAAARRPAGDAENEGREWWRFGLLGRSVALARIKFVGGVAYYVLEVDDQYAGEFRFKFIRELYLGLAPVLPGDCPEFPSRTLLRPWSAAALEERRAALERFLVYVLGASFTPGRCRACHMSSRAPPRADDPQLVRREEFLLFVKVRRRWAGELPLLKSPLLGASTALP